MSETDRHGRDAPSRFAWRQVAWGELALVTAVAGTALTYLIEARGVSLNPGNLLLLQPTVWIVLGLWALLAWGCLRPAPPTAPPESWTDFSRTAAMVLAFVLFILVLEEVGYDLAIWGFMVAALFIGGERRWPWLILFPPVFAWAVVQAFRWLIPYPFPVTLI